MSTAKALSSGVGTLLEHPELLSVGSLSSPPATKRQDAHGTTRASLRYSRDGHDQQRPGSNLLHMQPRKQMSNRTGRGAFGVRPGGNLSRYDPETSPSIGESKNSDKRTAAGAHEELPIVRLTSNRY